jgi:hypothetical protein
MGLLVRKENGSLPEAARMGHDLNQIQVVLRMPDD